MGKIVAICFFIFFVSFFTRLFIKAIKEGEITAYGRFVNMRRTIYRKGDSYNFWATLCMQLLIALSLAYIPLNYFISGHF